MRTPPPQVQAIALLITNEGQLKLQKEIAETKADLVKWVVAVGLLQITIITSLLLRLTGKL